MHACMRKRVRAGACVYCLHLVVERGMPQVKDEDLAVDTAGRNDVWILPTHSLPTKKYDNN